MPTILQDLPVELLALICDELGGRELRRLYGPEQKTKLALCRKWYDAARSVYASGLEVANVNVFGHNLGDLTQGGLSYAVGKRKLMHKNTRRLRLRVLDHPWDRTGAEVIEQNSGVNSEDDFHALPQPIEITDNRWDWSRGPDLSDDAQYETCRTWPSTVKSNLDDLASDLRKFTALEQLIVEASGTFEFDNRRQDANYLDSRTIYNLVSNLPVMHNLSALTLDLCGSNFLPLEGGGRHICPALANMWPRIANVRIKMRQICTAIFALPDTAALPTEQLRCKSVVFKLHVPAFQAGRDRYDVRTCNTNDIASPVSATNAVIKASQTFLERIAKDYGHRMDLFRISYIYRQGPDVSCVDCLTWRTLYLPEEFFCYDDDGKPCWFEHKQFMRQGPAFLLVKSKKG
ncbi:hypothetical protein EJ03DRAFT_351190 [Teratosphaeria nubilosa]|uniref:F-box domain-containing protein n=1 Tax=Teratosphaeria nubilosa TaxID=161662 RepID=A0A6G1L9Y8_9PEZI|nr:hypothetical protein EJ03DRAFT_351190 [Teratosphaeria nubilosa]